MEAPIKTIHFLVAVIWPPEEMVITIEHVPRALNQIRYFDMNITMNICA